MRMHLKMVLNIVLMIGLFFSTTSLFALEQQNIIEAIKKVEETIHQNIANKRIPGCAIAVIYGNEIIFMQGYGVRKLGSNEKIDTETVFQLGSVSKPIAATLAAVLETQGFLNLDDPVVAYLPDFHLNSKQPTTALKISNVLSHTTGLTRGGFNNMIESFKSHEEIVDALQTVRPKKNIGQHFDYNNAMYGLMTDITESATHLHFETALSSYLLVPLKMKNTTASLQGLLSNPNRAFPHTRNKRGVLCACDDYSKGYYTVAPAGGINSSVHDMANFLKAQMGNVPQLLNSRVLARIQTAYTSTKNLLGSVPGSNQRIKDASYGLGWRIIDYANNKLVYHGGWLRGFTNYVGFMPDQKLGIVILHNADTKFSSKTAMKFFEVALGLPEVKENPINSTNKIKKNRSGRKKNRKNKKY